MLRNQHPTDLVHNCKVWVVQRWTNIGFISTMLPRAYTFKSTPNPHSIHAARSKLQGKWTSDSIRIDSASMIPIFKSTSDPHGDFQNFPYRDGETEKLFKNKHMCTWVKYLCQLETHVTKTSFLLKGLCFPTKPELTMVQIDRARVEARYQADDYQTKNPSVMLCLWALGEWK